MTPYTPNDWYWISGDGRIFSSKRQSIVSANDTAYEAWVGEGNVATHWPKDESGNQTNAALQDVLTPYGIFVDLVAYAANARYLKETGGITVTGMPVATDRSSQAMIGNAFASAKDDATFTTKFKGANGAFVSLTNASILALGRAVRDHVNACFSKEADVVAGINASPPTIDSIADIDAAFATVTA